MVITITRQQPSNCHRTVLIIRITNTLNKNKHLPNTPSANELAEKGMNLKEITVVQQESIEQLYLHIIALEKRLKELEAKQ